MKGSRSSAPEAAVAGVILAGGRSSRMGGCDKTLIEIAGSSLLARIVERLRPQVGLLAISANGDPARFGALGLPVIADSIPGHAGPLAGILAAMDWASGIGHDEVVTVAGDTPFFPPELVVRLRQSRTQGSSEVAVAASLARRHPVFALWPVALRTPLRAHLSKSGSGRVSGFIEANGSVQVDFPAQDGIDPFFNVNTPGDLVEAEAFIRRSGA